MNEEQKSRWLMRWWDIRAFFHESREFFTALGFFAGVFVFAMLVQEWQEYLTPKAPWPGWAVVVVIGAVLFALSHARKAKK